MAVVYFLSFFATMTGEKNVRIEADTLGDLCRQLIERYGSKMSILLDTDGSLSRRIAVLVDKRNATSLSGAATRLGGDSEVQIMPLLTGG
jgi:molybdopterin converting factor small subunit